MTVFLTLFMIVIACLLALLWFHAMDTSADLQRAKLQLAAWQRVADARAAHLQALNDDALACARKSLASSKICMERTDSFLAGARKRRDRG